MRLKPDVLLARLTPQLVLALVIAEGVWQRYGQVLEVRITAGSDGVHAGHPVAGEDKDPHYTGRAADLGLKEVPVNLRGLVCDELRAALGPMFRVIREFIGGPLEHVHVQYEGAS